MKSRPRDVEAMRARRDRVLLRLLLRVGQMESAELARRLEEKGHDGIQPGWMGLLGNVDTEGVRLVDLAPRLGVTRQAVGQLVAELEKRGMLERTPHPDDGRAVLVRHTGLGRKILGDALDLMEEIERGYEKALGKKRMAELRRALTELADHLEPSWRFGR